MSSHKSLLTHSFHQFDIKFTLDRYCIQKMQPNATDVAQRVVCYVVLSTMVSPAKTLSRLICHLGGKLMWAQGTMHQMGYSAPLGKYD